MIPARSLEGVDIMSANLLLDHDTDPVIWRGPVIAGAVKQFWTETLMERCRLHVCRYASWHWRCSSDCIPVTSCGRYYYRYLSSGAGRNDRSKAVNMAKKMDVPILVL